MINKHLTILTILICLFIGMSLQAEVLLELFGQPRQGELLKGKLSGEVDSILLDNQPVALNDSIFYLGFSRDAEVDHKLFLQFSNGDTITTKFKIWPKQYKISEINTLPKKYTDTKPNKKRLARINREQEEREQIFHNISCNELLYAREYIRPVPEARISTTYGAQRILNGVARKPHYGVDVAIAKGTPVKAMASGIVVLAADFYYNGKYIIIDHGLGISSHYMHLSKMMIKQGDIVKAGDFIGAVGSTGRSTGPHLHWGLRWIDDFMDPESVFNLDESFLVMRKQ